MTQTIIKNTPARSAVSKFLSTSQTPVDIEQIIIYLRSKKLNTNKVTVYRIMDFFYKNDLIDKLEFGEGKFRYEIKKDHHHHLICSKCGGVTDIPDNFTHSFEKEIKDKKGFLVKSHSLEFFGVCKKCQN